MPSQSLMPLYGTSLFVLSVRNPLRRLCYTITSASHFDSAILFVIVFSSLLLTFEFPLNDPESTFRQVISILDKITTGIFTIEMVLKIIRYGFIFNGRSSYIRNAWNILDFVIVIFALIGLFLGGSSLDKLKILRILRVLRPLRLISRNEGLKLAINSFFLSIPNIMNLMIICLVFVFLFGIIGVNFFKGTNFICSPDNDLTSFAIANKEDCLNWGFDWLQRDFHFDNILEAMKTLFVVSTTEGWVNLMNNGIDSVGIDQQPVRNYQPT